MTFDVLWSRWGATEPHAGSDVQASSRARSAVGVVDAVREHPADRATLCAGNAVLSGSTTPGQGEVMTR